MDIIRKLLFVVFILMLGLSTQAEPLRGVYVNGKIHYFTLTGSDVKHQAGVPSTSSWVWGSQQTQTTPLKAGYVYVSQWGEGTAVMNDKIFYFPIGVPGNNTSNGRTLYCASFNLTSNTFDKTVIPLGQVNKDYQGVGSAAVAFSPPNQTQGTLYVFSDSKTYTSGDGINWASHDPLRSPGEMVEPIDAIVFYPPDSDPLIMIVYMKQESYYAGNGLYAAIWNGKFGSSSRMTWTTISSDRVYSGALFLGTVGSTSPYKHGAAAPCVQLFTNNFTRWEYAYDSTGGGKWIRDKDRWMSSDDSLGGERAFLWYEAECSKNQNNHIERQFIVLNADKSTTEGKTDWKGLRIISDAMVPINKTDLGLNCNAWGGSITATNIPDSDMSDTAVTYRKYWTLVGVIMGSPPFALNNWAGFELEEFSNVSYGSESTGQVSHSEERENTLMFSSGLTVMAGIGHILGVEDQFDLGYKHGWESNHKTTSTTTKGFNQTFGTSLSNTEHPDEMGKYGWALFNVPTIVVQDYALYAYDYNVDTAAGTALNQDLHSVQVLTDNITVVPKAFELANPGGSYDDIPKLLAGIGPFAKSTDINWWSAVPWTWESKTSPWSVVLGEKTDPTISETLINTLTFTNGAGGSVYFSQEQENVETTGYTSDVDISATTKISVGTKLEGFKISLAAGYDSHYAQSVANSTSWEKSVTASLGMKPCSDPDCIKSMTIQPYLLRAVNGSNNQLAPWVPTNYNSQQPWCMTWSIKSYTTNSGKQVGTSVPPESANVTVVADDGVMKKSSYSIKGGSMAWVDDSGSSSTAPITADTFDLDTGASITLNGYKAFATNAFGKWSRGGQVWKFKSRDSIKRDRLTLKLDFRTHTWDADLSNARLDSSFTSAGDLRLTLLLNGKLGFQSAFTPHVHTTWDRKAAAVLGDNIYLTGYSGEYDSARGKGNVTLMGNLPRSNDGAGDMAFLVNGRQGNIPLISLKGYDQAVSKGRKLTYDNGGIRLVVDYGKRTWKAVFVKDVFHPLLAPRWGYSRITISMGGVRLYTQEHGITDHTTILSFKR